MAMSTTTVISPINVEARRKVDVRVGDTVRVHQKIEDKGKTRVQVFEGLVIARKHGAEAGGTFTVRRSSGAYGVEKIFPLYAPMIDKIEVTGRSRVRRSKLYYIRDKATRQIKRQMRNRVGVPEVAEDEVVEEAPDAEPDQAPETAEEASIDASADQEAGATENMKTDDVNNESTETAGDSAADTEKTKEA